MDEAYQDKEPSSKEWRGFWTLLAVQAQNAFNEKAAQFLLIPLGASLWGAGGNLEYTLGAIIVLPYLIVSPFVGWLSDRFCKARIVQFMAFMQILVMAGMWYSLHNHNIHGAIVWFTVFAIQATVLSPAKKGIVKDIVGTARIGFASGLMEMSAMLALLAGQIGVFVWFDYLYRVTDNEWLAASEPTLILLLLAVPVSLASLLLPRYPVLKQTPFRWSLFYEHFGQIKELWADRNLRLSETGISYFWFFATTMILITIQIAKEVTGGGEGFGNHGAELMAWLSGGVVVGGVIVSILNRRRIELGMIPMGTSGMTICCILLAIFPIDSWGFLISLSLAGASGAFFLVPLNGYLQDSCSDDNRGNIIAAGNFIDMTMGLVAVVFQFALKILGFSIASQFVILAITTFFITVVAFRLVPREFIKLLGMWLIQLFFRPRILNADRIPRSGGVLLVSNHVTLADALLLTIVVPRPIRFVVAEEYIAVRAFGWILELFNSLPISSKSSKATVLAAAEALKNGEVICIFPEGQLTRTGGLSQIHPGFEIIARRAKAPVLPIYMDGLWGGFLSYLASYAPVTIPRHWPRWYTVGIGQLMPYKEASIANITRSLQELSSVCLSAVRESGRARLIHNLEQLDLKKIVQWKGGEWTAHDVLTAYLEGKAPEGDSPGHKWMQAFVSIISDKELLEKSWYNAQQIARVNALRPGEMCLTTMGENEPHERVIGLVWALLTNTPLYLLSHERFIPAKVRQIAGSKVMRERLQQMTPLARRIPFYDFSQKSFLFMPNIAGRPGYATEDGWIISISMNQEVYIADENTLQLGLKPHSLGKLLPGFIVRNQECDGNMVTMIDGENLGTLRELPMQYGIDEDHFVVEKRN